MPNVGGKKYPYTAAGRAAALAAERRKKLDAQRKKKLAAERRNKKGKKPSPSLRGNATRSQMGSWERGMPKPGFTPPKRTANAIRRRSQ